MILYTVTEQAIDGDYVGRLLVVLTPAEYVAWMLWKLGA